MNLERSSEASNSGSSFLVTPPRSLAAQRRRLIVHLVNHVPLVLAGLIATDQLPDERLDRIPDHPSDRRISGLPSQWLVIPQINTLIVEIDSRTVDFLLQPLIHWHLLSRGTIDVALQSVDDDDHLDCISPIFQIALVGEFVSLEIIEH